MTDASTSETATYSSLVDVQVLGPLDVCRGDHRLSVGGPKQRAVLANLVAAENGLSMDRLITEIYGPDASPSAKRSIHTYISNLRQELGGVVVREGHTYCLLPDAIRIDARVFESTYRKGAGVLEDDPRDAARLTRSALGMWRGHPYAGVVAGPLVDGEAARLNELRLGALQTRIDADLALGMHDDLVGELEALVTEHPFVERFHAQRMLALYRSGRQQEALRAYGRLEAFLAEELGIEPSRPVRNLEEAILLQAPALDLDVHPLVERRAILATELPDSLVNASPAERDRALALRNDDLDTELHRHGGESGVGYRGTAAYASFVDVSDALEVARTVSSRDMNVAIPLGEVEICNSEITGPPMSRSARLAAAAHPGQILLSEQAQLALSKAGAVGWSVKSLGRHRFAGVDAPLMVFEGLIDGVERSFPALDLDRLPPPVPAGHRSVAGYELRERLAVHDHSTEYRVYHHVLGREVSLQVFETPLVSEPNFIRRFEAELQRVARLDHPNLLPILDFWRNTEQAVVVSRLATHGSLEAALPGGTDIDTTTSIVAAVGLGIAHAHDAGVLHGALTPAAIVLDSGDRPYVTGFGVAHLIDGPVADRHDVFAPPEREITIATDVYGLGKIAEWLLRDRSGAGWPSVAAVIARATDHDPFARHRDVREFIEDLVQASGDATTSPLDRTERRNPYKGLAAFGEADAGDFFARDELTEATVNKVTTGALTLVVGPSGVGKSSVVRAGLIPALRRNAIDGSEQRLVTDMFPGAHPFEQLATALTRISPSRPEALVEKMRTGDTNLTGVIAALLPGEVVLLLVDQLEEVFTQTVSEAERKAFLEVLSDAARVAKPVVRVVATLRADFFDRPLMDPTFGEALQDRVVNVHALDVAGLAEVVREPARGVGAEIADDLVWTVAHDAAEGLGGLPLLQYALAGVFETRRTDRMTLEDYARTGGLHGSIAMRAEDVFAGLSPEDKALSRVVFTELVSVAEGVEDTRRRVALRDLQRLERSPGSIGRVLEAFATQRLLTFDRDAISRCPTVELAHEAVLAQWERLRSWIDEVRADLLTSRRVEQASREWEESGRDPSFLIGGARLEHAEGVASQSPHRPGTTAVEFLEESRKVEDLARHRRRRSRRNVIVALTAGLIIVTALGIAAAVQGRAAELRALDNRVAELTSEAQRATEEDPDLAINLALAAYEASHDIDPIPPSVTQALQATLLGSHLESVIPHGALAFSSDGLTAAIEDGDRRSVLRLFDVPSGEEIANREFGFEIGSVAHHPTEPLLAVAPEMSSGAGPALVIVDAATLATVEEVGAGRGAYGLSFSDDGSLVAGVDPAGTLRIWDTANPTTERQIAIPRPIEVYGGSTGGTFVPGTSRIAVAIGDAVLLVDGRTGSEVDRVELPEDGYVHLAAHPDGDTLALSNRTGTRVDLISLSTGAVQSLGGFISPMDLAISPDGTTMVVGGTAAIATAIDLRTLERTPLPGHGGGATAVAAAEGRVLVQSRDRGLHIWRSDGPVPGDGSLRLDEGELWWTAFSPDGARAATMALPPEANSASVSLVDTATGRVLHRHHFASLPWAWPQISEDGELAVGLNADTGVAEVVETETGSVLLPLRPCEAPRSINHAANVVAVVGDCTVHPAGVDPDRPPRTGVIDLVSGDLILHIPFQPQGLVVVGEPGTPSEDLVLVAAPRAELQLWRLSTGSRLSSWKLPDATLLDGILALRFFEDGSAIVFGEQNGRLAVFDTAMIEAGASLDEAVRFAIQGHVERSVSLLDTATTSSHRARRSDSGMLTPVSRSWSGPRRQVRRGNGVRRVSLLLRRRSRPPPACAADR